MTRDSNTQRSDGRAIRVVIQNGEYWLCNKGDLAMLDVTVRRIRERWPDAHIGVLTSAPLLLHAFEPGTEPLSVRGNARRPIPGAVGRLAERAGPRLVGGPSMAWLTAREIPRQYARRAAKILWHRPDGGGRSRSSTVRNTDASTVPAALRTASLVLAMGGGYFTDVDADQAGRTLDLLQYAVDRDIPAVMVGQGLGPMEDPGLLEHAARVLPRVGYIGLREGRRGPALLAGLGVPADRVSVTGDDAIELAHNVRQATMGTDVGICLRVAEYSPVAEMTRDSVGRSVRRFAGELGASLVPLIISEYRSEDRRSTLPLVAGYPNTIAPLGRHVTPHEVAARVSRCRVLVTGAYHLGVFALAQGIPVVGLSSSRYYDDKLLGLNAMFGGAALHLVRIDEPDLDARLDHAIRSAWADAPGLRDPLRERASAQIAASRKGFERVFDLVEDARAKARQT